MPSSAAMGVCKLCRQYKALTFEHTPPRRCFNDGPQAVTPITDLMQMQSATGKDPRTNSRLRSFRRGLGTKSLCESCNGNTAKWYGDAFFEWTKQGARFVENLAESTYTLPFTIYPLRVIKQIATMAVAHDFDQDKNSLRYERIRQLLLHKNDSGDSGRYRFFSYLCPHQHIRLSGPHGRINDDRRIIFVDLEIATFPFGYVVTGSDSGTVSRAQALGLCEITHFLNKNYDDFTTAHLNIPMLKPSSVLPLALGDTPACIVSGPLEQSGLKSRRGIRGGH
jgi:hypothetical protein